MALPWRCPELFDSSLFANCTNTFNDCIRVHLTGDDWVTLFFEFETKFRNLHVAVELGTTRIPRVSFFLVDGRLPHEVMPFTGRRYCIIWYKVFDRTMKKPALVFEPAHIVYE